MFNSSLEMGLKQAKASTIKLVSTALFFCDSTIIKMWLQKWQIILCTPQKIEVKVIEVLQTYCWLYHAPDPVFWDYFV